MKTHWPRSTQAPKLLGFVLSVKRHSAGASLFTPGVRLIQRGEGEAKCKNPVSLPAPMLQPFCLLQRECQQRRQSDSSQTDSPGPFRQRWGGEVSGEMWSPWTEDLPLVTIFIETLFKTPPTLFLKNSNAFMDACPHGLFTRSVTAQSGH